MDCADPVAFRHEAFIYRDEEQYLRGTLDYLREGLDAREAVLVAALPPRTALLREALGEQAAGVEFLDLTRVGRNPGRILPAWQDWIERNAAHGRGLRGVCEPQLAGRSAAELLECRLHEQLLNAAFGGPAGPAWSLLCPYDAGQLAAEVLGWARHTHPLVFEDGNRLRSATYPHPEAAFEVVFAAPLPEPDPVDLVAALDFGVDSLDLVRALVRARAARLGLGTVGVLDLALVASELAANSVRHGGGSGRLRLWRQGRYAVCEVRDRGLITDPMVGLRRPDFRKNAGGAGLWAVNRLCDLVVIRSTAEQGTVVRAHYAVG
jgi:anti-sigma regulatory factor (Ser/Thr protein kinase)